MLFFKGNNKSSASTRARLVVLRTIIGEVYIQT